MSFPCLLLYADPGTGLLAPGNSEPSVSPVTLLLAIWQKISVRLPGERLAPLAPLSTPGPCVCFPRAAPGLFAGRVCIQDQLLILPSQSILPWLQGPAWVRGPQAQTSPQGQVPSPGTAPASLPVSHNVLLSLPVLMGRLFSTANLCHYRPVSPALAITVHTPLPSVQLRTAVLPPCCRWLSPL